MQLLCVALLVAMAEGFGLEPSLGHGRPVVTTREGSVRGAVSRSASGRRFYSFRGMRYARPPLGQLRFEPPQRHPGWQDVFDAGHHGSRCPQFDLFDNSKRQGSEDCLFVNVHTPLLPAPRENGSADVRAGLPVMVYVHGGGFYFGAGDNAYLGPAYLMDEDVVLVTFNYRLGVFGFFTTHDAAAPGNYGLLDQVLLLRWVQDNIGAFGGDRRQVTVFGQSAGGASVSLLVLSPLTRGLFHHAISQSGAAAAHFAVNGKKKDLAEMVAGQVNCTNADVPAMVSCIRGVPAERLLDAMFALSLDKDNFRPRVDRESEQPFLPDDPRTLLETGSFNLMPWLSGVAEQEAALFLPLILPTEEFAAGVFAGVPRLWSLYTVLSSINPAERTILDCDADLAVETTRVLSFYSANGTTGPPFNQRTLSSVASDRVLAAASAEEIRLASAHAPVYKYVLDHRGPGRQSFAELVNWTVPSNVAWPDPELGVTHCDDLLYLFSVEGRPLAPPDSPGGTMIRFMVNLWTNFARTGRPSSDVLAMPDWPIFTEKSQRHMRLNSQPSLGQRLFEERINFWKTVRINESWRHAVQADCEQVKADIPV